ncbi:DUF3084 family protein [Hydrogenispora ethanolica]|uniref:DUF3084 family protein n=1 Tax=Hydrogenispora ethanolica TaxID=1082276 RepID=A0A4R1RD73_HYDET|nr:DUF3084 domain-containing protein [Hydrogenispora ethanolica]TCL63739.1 DUF3084 family protein [Hydrogenispora ethanolica]
MFGLEIIAAVVIFGGLLALLGDRVGMKVGKKRLSMFGLRPKYTSMIITVLTGFFIAGLTLLILTLMSDYVRKALFELKTIEQNLQVTTKKVQTLTDQIQLKEQEYRDLTLRNDELHRNLQIVVKQRKQVERQLESTQEQYQHAAVTLQEVKSNLSSTKEELELAQNRMANLTKINNDLKDQMSNLTLQEARLNQQIQNLEGWLKSLEDQNRNYLDKPIIFYVGEILVAKVVNPGIHADRIYAEAIEPLLKEANEVALKRGAQIPGKSNYALRVAPKRLAEVTTQVAGLSVKSIVRVVVEKNSVSSEPVTVTLEVYPDQVVFAAGEAIANATLSSNSNESELRDQLLSLLILANNKAIEKGIITEGQNLRNVVSISEIAATIKAIREQKSTNVNVSVAATQDIRRIDQFKIKFEIRK